MAHRGSDHHSNRAQLNHTICGGMQNFGAIHDSLVSPDSRNHLVLAIAHCRARGCQVSVHWNTKAGCDLSRLNWHEAAYLAEQTMAVGCAAALADYARENHTLRDAANLIAFLCGEINWCLPSKG